MLYALVRSDLSMTAGKAASQAGHAFLDSFLSCCDPDVCRAYRADDGGTKIVLSAPNEAAIRRAYGAACAAGIPASIVLETEPGHALPVATAVGIGPVDRAAAKPITRKFSLMK